MGSDGGGEDGCYVAACARQGCAHCPFGAAEQGGDGGVVVALDVAQADECLLGVGQRAEDAVDVLALLALQQLFFGRGDADVVVGEVGKAVGAGAPQAVERQATHHHHGEGVDAAQAVQAVAEAPQLEHGVLNYIVGRHAVGGDAAGGGVERRAQRTGEGLELLFCHAHLSI